MAKTPLGLSDKAKSAITLLIREVAALTGAQMSNITRYNARVEFIFDEMNIIISMPILKAPPLDNETED